jgi:hypothetical protein
MDLKIGMHEFYQPSGFLHDRRGIHAADAPRTRITGDFQLDYTSKPISCDGNPWYDRVFANSQQLADGHMASVSPPRRRFIPSPG